MKTTILSAFAFAVLLEAATAIPPTEAAPDVSAQAAKIAQQYDKMIAGTENQLREMRGLKSRFDPTIRKATRQHRPRQYVFRNPEQKRQEILNLEAALAAMRATRWESAIPCSIDAQWMELKVGDLAIPIDYSTGKPAPIQATVKDVDDSGRAELEVTWPGFFPSNDIDYGTIYVEGTDLRDRPSLDLPALWVKRMTDSPSGQRFVCEFATPDQIKALEREISRITPPDRKPREWSDVSGTHKTAATLASYDRKTDQVTLERTDGTRIQLDIGKLSLADRELVELTLGAKITARAPMSLVGGRDPD